MGKSVHLARRRGALLFAVLLVLSNGLLFSVGGVSAQTSTLTGVFTTLFLDPPPGSAMPSREIYQLSDATGKLSELRINPATLEAAGGGDRFDRQTVTVTGVAIPTAQADATPAIAVQSLFLAKGSLNAVPRRQVVGGQAYVNVLCKFQDVAQEPATPAYITNLMSAAYPGLGNFFNTVSYGNISLLGTVTYPPVGWYTLPHPKAYYVPSADPNYGLTSTDLDRIFQDCAGLLPPELDMTPFIGLNFMLNDLIGCCAVGGTGRLVAINGVTKFWSSTWDPPWGYMQYQNYVGGQTVLAHEMGHAFGLHHSAGPTGVTYQNSWDVMSDTYTNCDQDTDPTYGCLGQNMNAYDKDRLGWIPANQKFTYAGAAQTLTFGALADAATTNMRIAYIPHIGTTTQFTTVEYRRQMPTGYDKKLAGSAIIIHDVDTSRLDPAWVQGTDGNTGAMFTPAGVSTYAVPNSGGVTVTVTAIAGATATVTIGPPAPRIPPAPSGRPGGAFIGVPSVIPPRPGPPSGGTPNPIPTGTR
jgi:hypothetical protein